jgi:hypothetical protein
VGLLSKPTAASLTDNIAGVAPGAARSTLTSIVTQVRAGGNRALHKPRPSPPPRIVYPAASQAPRRPLRPRPARFHGKALSLYCRVGDAIRTMRSPTLLILIR